MSYRPRRDDRSWRDGGNRHRGYHDRGDRKPYQRPQANKLSEREEIENRLSSLIIKIGDKILPVLEINLGKMIKILNDDFKMYPETVTDTLKACVSEIPAKAPVYGCLVGLFNETNNKDVAHLMAEFNSTLTDSVEASDWSKVKILFRFYGELVNANVIRPSSYCDMINDLLEGLKAPNQPRLRLDCFVYIILSTLPWCGKELNERVPANLDEILKTIETYMQRRGKIDTLNLLKPWRQNYDIPSDMLSHLWSLTLELQNNDWNVPVLPKPYLWFDKNFTNSLQHEVPRFKLPPHSEKSNYMSPQRILKLLIDEQGESLPTTPQHDSLAYFLVHDVIADTIRTFESNRKECTKYLRAVAGSFEQGYFRLDDQDDSMDTQVAQWSLSEILIEAVFTQMLLLPSSPFLQVFYSCLLTELCKPDGPDKNARSDFPKALGWGIKTLFDRLEHMDTECVHRLWSWFAHHLSNFGFKWDWASWKEALSQDPFHPQFCFIRETLDKEVRLSYHGHIQKSVEDAFSPEEFNLEEPRPDFEYGAEDHTFHQVANKVVESLRYKKKSNTDEDKKKSNMDDEEENVVSETLQDIKKEHGEKVAREIFTQSLLQVGCKSFSHTLSIIERNLNFLCEFNETPEAQLQTVQSAARFWKYNAHCLTILLDKLLNYRVINPSSVIEWAFEPEQMQNAGRSFPWEILKNTLSKVTGRVAILEAQLANFEEKHKINEEERSKDPPSEQANEEARHESETLDEVRKKLRIAASERLEIFVDVHKRFVRILGDTMSTHSAQGQDPKLDWTYYWIEGWFREVLRAFHNDCASFFHTLESLVFTSQVDPRIVEIFQETRALHDQENANV